MTPRWINQKIMINFNRIIRSMEFIYYHYRFAIAHLLNGNVLLMGGKKDGNRINGCHEYNYKDKWVKPYKGFLTAPRSGMGAVVSNELIYLIGGNNG